MESPLLLAQAATKALMGLPKNPTKACPTCDKTYKWQQCLHYVFLVPGNISTHFSGGRTRALPGRFLCPCCDSAAAHSIFGCLLQGRDSKMRQDTVHALPTNPWQILIHCIQEPGPIHANGFDLAAFIPTLPLCERSKGKNMGELQPGLQAHLRSQAFCFFQAMYEIWKGILSISVVKKK